MTHRHRIVSVALALLLITTAFATPALAQEEDADGDFFGDLVTEEDAKSWAISGIKLISKATGWVARTSDKYTSDESDATASTYATDFADEYNANSAEIESYTNQRLTATADYDTFAIHFRDQEDGYAQRYFVSDVANGNWSNTRIVDAETFEQTGRTVDYTVELDWYVSKHAADELDHFVDTYAEDDKNLTTTYKTKMVGKYGSGLESGLWSNETEDA